MSLIGIALLACAQPSSELPQKTEGAFSSSDFNYESYGRSTIDQTTHENPSPAPDGIVTLSPVVKIRTAAMFSGSIAPLRPEFRDVIVNWALDVGAEKTFVDLFQHELMVEQNGSKFSLPIQEPLLDYLRSEVSGVATIELFMMLIGSNRNERVFLVNEFAVPQ